jgi:YbbR domain-containing protein
VRIFDNLLYKLVSLLIAGLLWAAAQGVRDMEEGFDVPVTYTDLPSELVVVEQSAQEINLRLRGSRAALREVRRDLSDYTVSLGGVKEGDAQFPVLPENLALPRGSQVTARSPSLLVFRTEKLLSKSVDVRPDIAGELPEGYRLAAVRVQPDKIEIEGARTEVRRMREVATQRVDVAALRETTTLDVPILWGIPNVWRKDGRGEPVKVTLVVEAPPAPEPPQEVLEEATQG